VFREHRLEALEYDSNNGQDCCNPKANTRWGLPRAGKAGSLLGGSTG